MSDETRILIVEDDENLRLGLCDNLEDEGYAVVATATVAAARRALAERTFDLILLDIMLPDGDGYSLCRLLRAEGVASRVLMLTARTLEDDLVQGFDAGADDYLAKPYRLRELLARVRALLRRGVEAAPGPIRFAGYALDPQARALTDTSGAGLDLTRTEFDLLAYLLRHRGRALSRHEILDAVWGDVIVDPRTVDNFVSNLKRKLGWTPESTFSIRTVRGVGYRMEVDG